MCPRSQSNADVEHRDERRLIRNKRRWHPAKPGHPNPHGLRAAPKGANRGEAAGDDAPRGEVQVRRALRRRAPKQQSSSRGVDPHKVGLARLRGESRPGVVGPPSDFRRDVSSQWSLEVSGGRDGGSRRWNVSDGQAD